MHTYTHLHKRSYVYVHLYRFWVYNCSKSFTFAIDQSSFGDSVIIFLNNFFWMQCHLLASSTNKWHTFLSSNREVYNKQIYIQRNYCVSYVKRFTQTIPHVFFYTIWPTCTKIGNHKKMHALAHTKVITISHINFEFIIKCIRVNIISNCQKISNIFIVNK